MTFIFAVHEENMRVLIVDAGGPSETFDAEAVKNFIRTLNLARETASASEPDGRN